MPNKLERLHVVVGSSMKPFFMPGTLVEIKQVAEKELRIGDVICFQRKFGDSLRLHRVCKIIFHNGHRLFKLRGDNLFKSDGFFSIDQILGVVVAKRSAGRKKSFAALDRYLGLFFSPFLCRLRSFGRKFIVRLMPIIFPLLELKKISFSNDNMINIVFFGDQLKLFP